MKLSTTIFAALLTVVSFNSMSATNPNQQEPVVKVLPHNEVGFVKLLYVNNEKNHVSVSFYDSNGMIIKDKIKGNKFDGGFVKMYDLTELKPGKYWVKISDSNTEIKYEIVHSIEKPVWASYWSNEIPTGKIIASK